MPRRRRLISADELEAFIKRLLREGRADEFYWIYAWKAVSAEVIKRNHNECLRCKEQGRVRRARHVHHHFPMRRYPRWALSEFVTLESGEVVRNLYPLCELCHEEIETVRHTKKIKKSESFVNEERW